MSDTTSLRGGQIWYAWLDPIVGREQGGRRPVVIVSSSLLHTVPSALVMTVPLTTVDRGVRADVPVSVHSGALEKNSFALTEQLRAISRERLSHRIAVADADTMALIRKYLAWFLDLD